MVVLAPWIWLKFSDKPEYPERTAGLGKIAYCNRYFVYRGKSPARGCSATKLESCRLCVWYNMVDALQ